MSYDDALMHPARAQEFLASHLRAGTLVLFLGAGASIGLGLPGWTTYINRLRLGVGLPAVDESIKTDDLQLAANEVRRECKSQSQDDYFKLLKECLYAGMDTLSLDVVMQNKFLMALGALLMGSRRGNIRRVVTFNFDSMLEWVLLLYGFTFRVVYRLPELEGSEDVRIYHPHGFLPHPSLDLEDSDFVILDLNSVDTRLGTVSDPWPAMIRYLLGSGLCLFVGLSERTLVDRSLSPLLTTTGKQIDGQRVTGIWLLRNSIEKAIEDQFLDNNVVPIVLRSANSIADFLMGICQKSASSITI